MKLNETTKINLSKLIETRLLVQANSGGGKSWLIRRILEESHGKVQQIVIDPEGEFGTLREKYDYILAGKGGDTPAEPRSAALLARKLLELRVSAVIDLYELPPQERKRFVRLFLDAMVNAPKELYHEVLIVLDEAHMFVPEKEQSEAASAVIDLCTRGRKRGFCAVLATQRISKMAKDAAAECNNKLIGRTGLDIDMKRASEELGFTTKEQLLSLRKLKPGEFYAFGPAISDEVKQVTIGPVHTSHPKIGARAISSVTPPTVAIRKLLGQLADLPQEAEKEAKTLAELKSENSTLKRENTLLKKQPVSQVKTVEVAVLKDAQITRLEKVFRDMTREAERHGKAMSLFWGNFNDVGDSMLKALYAMKNPTKQAATIVQKPIPPRTIAQVPPTEGEPSGPEQRILNAIAWLESIGVEEPEQTAVAFLAGYTYGGGGFNNPKGSLRTKGLVEYRGKNIVLTDAGREAAKVPDYPLTQEELHQKVLSVLPGPEQRILRPLLDRYPEAIPNQELADLAGYAFGSGGFNNPKGRLRTLGLIEYLSGGSTKARDILFIS